MTKVLRVSEATRSSPYWVGTETPPPEVYRFDGSETIVHDQRDARRERRHSFRLVADALALTANNVRHTFTCRRAPVTPNN